MKVKFINFAILCAAIFCLSAVSTALAQESEAVVVDEVVAQVNDSVITLSSVKKEMQGATDVLIKQGKKPEEAKAEIERKKGELIANLINEELILQKGKEIGVDQDVEGEINRRLISIMKDQGFKTVDELNKAMLAENVNPESLRELWRKQITRDAVIQREVSSKYYYGLTDKQIKDYYEAHKSQFTKPETITLSELFLGYAGKVTDDVKAKADKLVAQARGGADFTKLVAENSDRPEAAQTKGSIGTLTVKEVNPQVADAVKNVKTGDVARLDVDEGVEIIRVDARSAASNESTFSEEAVRGAMTQEAIPAQQKKFMAELRKDAYIKVADPYNSLVTPYLNNDNTTTAETKASDK